MLTDLGQGGIAMVNDPVVSSADSVLPGYNAWAKNAVPQSPVLYAHTNDGLLRLIDPSKAGKGKEIMSIIPPPMLIPARLSTLKARWAGGDKISMLNVTGTEDMGGYRSFPAYTLDGSLQKRNFNLEQKEDGTGWGEYLLGALGRGGGGLYMLDVSKHVQPEMKWYREKIGGGLLVSSNIPSGYTSNVAYVYSEIDLGTDADKDYLKLGFNSPKPIMGVVPLPDSRRQNFIALAGGAMSDVPINPQKNGDEGATLLIVEPKDGSIIRAFTGSSMKDNNWRVGGDVTGQAPYMGMMVSEPIAFRSSSNPYLTGGIIAADNRGNIFQVDMEDVDTKAARNPVQWDIRTIATLQTETSSSSGADSYAIPHGVAVGRQSQGNAMWIAGGTADISVRKKATDNNSAGILKNKEQLIFSFMTNPAQAGPYNRDNFQSLDPDKLEDIFSINSGNGKTGWYFPLKKDGDDGNQNGFREYVCAKPILINGTLFVATFMQQMIDTGEDSSTCEPQRTFDGNSRLYAVDIRSGKATTWTDKDGNTRKYITFEHIKISSLTDLASGGKGKLLIRYEILSPSKNNLASLRERYSKLRNVRDRDGNSSNSDTIEEPEATGGGGNGVPPGTTIINYWLMK